MSRTAHHGRRHRTVRCHDCADTGCEWCRPKRLAVEALCPDDGMPVQRREIEPDDDRDPNDYAGCGGTGTLRCDCPGCNWAWWQEYLYGSGDDAW